MNTIVQAEHLLYEKEDILQNGLTYLFFNQEQPLTLWGLNQTS